MIIYSKFNNNYRKEEYQLITNIKRTDGQLYSFKVAQNDKAKDFLNSFIDKYNYLTNNNFSIDPIKPKKISGDKLGFKYKKGKTLEHLLFNAFQGNNKDDVTSLIKKYTELIKRNLIKNESLNPKFENIFGNVSDEKFECIQIGCLDLNFDNIFFDKNNKWNLIDYEWTFEFPIPYKYIVFRALSTFYFSNIAYNLDKFISLGDIYDLVEISNKEEKAFIVFEYNFQKYVNKILHINLDEFSTGYLRLKKEKVVGFNYFQQKDHEINNLNQAIQQKDQSIQQKDHEINNLNQAIQQKDQSIQQKDHEISNLNQAIQQKYQAVQQKDQEIAFMESSKFWKLREKYLKIRSVFSKNKK